MRILIAISLLFGFSAEANFKTLDDATDPTKPAYSSFKECQKKEKKHCVDTTNINLETHEVGTIKVDDFSKPIWQAKSQVIPCSDRQDCFSKSDVMEDVPHPLAGQPMLDNDGEPVLDNDGNPQLHPDTYKQRYCRVAGLSVVVRTDIGEVYCTKFLGYEKKDQQALVENAEKKAAYDKKMKDARDERKAKKDKRKQRRKDLKACAKNFDSLTDAEEKQCRKLLFKEQMQDELKSDEM